MITMICTGCFYMSLLLFDNLTAQKNPKIKNMKALMLGVLLEGLLLFLFLYRRFVMWAVMLLGQVRNELAYPFRHYLTYVVNHHLGLNDKIREIWLVVVAKYKEAS